MSDPAPVATRVTVEAIDISFGRLVLFFIKAAFAAIPATIGVMVIMMLIGFGLRAVFGFGYWGGHGYY